MKKICLLSFGLLAVALTAADLNFGNNGNFSYGKLPGRFFVLNRQHQAVPLAGKATGQGVKLTNPEFNCQVKAPLRDKLYAITFDLVNTSKRQLWLEPGVALTVPRASGDHFWGGFDVLPAQNKVLARRGFKGRTSKHIGGGLCQPFATASLIASNIAYILGQPPYEVCSYNAASYQPINAQKAVLKFSQRIVLEPGEKLTVNFSLGSAPVRFGVEQNVVQAFYDAYPEKFRPFVDQDNPYVWGAHSQYRAWYFKPSREQERRYYATIDWAYTPYKRSGDYYGRPRFWDYKPLVSDFKVGFGQYANGMAFDYKKLSIEKFHEMRKNIFERNGRDFGYSFYISVGWCELNLAQKFYPDSLTFDKDVPLVLGPWSTHHDRERRVFPWGNSYAQQVKQDIKDLVAELNMPGFALDCGTPGVNNRGAAAQNPQMPGRAWDDQGLFVDELCGTIGMINFIRQLRPKDPLYIWKNGQGPCDYQMIETDLFGTSFQSWMPLYRYNVAQRHAVLHAADGYMFDQTIPNWRNMSQVAFMKQWAKLGDYVVLANFEYGMSETHAAYGGNPQSVYCLPELLECLRNGWMALVPMVVTPDNEFYQRARYGRNANTILYLGNPWNEARQVDLKVDNRALGNAGFMFFVPKMRDWAVAENTIKNGDTCFAAQLPSRRPALFEAVLALSQLPGNGQLAATVRSQKDVHQMVYTVALKNKQAFKAAISPRHIRLYTPEITVNGQKVAAQTEVTIPAQATLKVIYKSNFFRNPAKKYLAFPFTDCANKPAFAIVLPAKPNRAELKEAKNLQGYFKFTAKKKVTKSGEIPVCHGVAKAKRPYVSIQIGRGAEAAIELDNAGNIRFAAPNAKIANEMMKELNYVMDRRYPYIFKLPAFTRTTGQVIKKFGLQHNVLPWSRCFENGVK